MPSTTHWPRRLAPGFVLLLIASSLAPAGRAGPGVLAAQAPDAAGDGQPSAAARTWEWAGVPALNYDSDEGFGYGVIVELYGYGRDRAARPYLWTVQPTLFLTTEGRRELTVFFDSPHLLPAGWRLSAFAGLEELIAAPYYGIGNDAPFDEALVTDANPYYYRFGRTRSQLTTTLQRRLGPLPLRVLLGAGVATVDVTPVPRDTGTTLLEAHMAAGDIPLEGWSNHVRAGLVWDTRDREVGSTRGAWSELLAQRFDGAIGSEYEYTRLTLADRRYIPFGGRLVYANRLLVQQVFGDAPFYDLYIVQTSFKQQEGLGGAKTIRGLPKNRYVGEGMFLWNAELRWRAADFRLAGRPSHLVLSGFVDSGRVWAERIDVSELLSDLHHGFGGGVRLGMGENFVVALDVGTSSELSAGIYIGLGYLY